MTDCTNSFQGMRFLVGSASYQNAVAVSPSNTVDLATVASALWVGVAGNVTVDLEGTGTGIVLKTVPAGLLKIRVTRVYASGTDATDIVALW